MKQKYSMDLIYVRAHTGYTDENSIGNSIADRLANDALKKFDNKQIDIRKFFKMSHNLCKEQLLLQHNLTYEVYEKFMNMFDKDNENLPEEINERNKYISLKR